MSKDLLYDVDFVVEFTHGTNDDNRESYINSCPNSLQKIEDPRLSLKIIVKALPDVPSLRNHEKTKESMKVHLLGSMRG